MQTLISSTDRRGVLTLCMNRPEVHNAFDAQMIHEMTTALKAADQDDAVRMVMITGQGTCFSAGADLNWMRSLVSASREENEQDALRLAELMRTSELPLKADPGADQRCGFWWRVGPDCGL